MEKNMNYDEWIVNNYNNGGKITEMDYFSKSILGGSFVVVAIAIGGQVLNINVPTMAYITGFVTGQYVTLLPMFKKMSKLQKNQKYLFALANEKGKVKTLK